MLPVASRTTQAPGKTTMACHFFTWKVLFLWISFENTLSLLWVWVGPLAILSSSSTLPGAWYLEVSILWSLGVSSYFNRPPLLLPWVVSILALLPLQDSWGSGFPFWSLKTHTAVLCTQYILNAYFWLRATDWLDVFQIEEFIFSSMRESRDALLNLSN